MSYIAVELPLKEVQIRETLSYIRHGRKDKCHLYKFCLSLLEVFERTNFGTSEIFSLVEFSLLLRFEVFISKYSSE